MKIVIVGATGFIGSAILKEALSRGHVVTAVARQPGRLKSDERLSVLALDLHDINALTLAIAGHQALISAFNPGRENPNLFQDQVRGTRDIIAAVKGAGIRRVLWVGGAGGLEVKPGLRLIDTPDFPAAVKPGALATLDALKQLRKEPELDWSYLSPSATMTAGRRTAKFRVGSDQLLVDPNGRSRISVEDYAVAMIDELEHAAHIRCRFTVGY
jgi:putative NADH-flavin reductase